MKTLNAVVTVDIDETLPNDFDLTLPETKKKGKFLLASMRVNFN